MNDCIGQCGIRHVLTSRRVMERFDLKLDAELVYLEDLHASNHAGRQAAGGRGRPGSMPAAVPGTPARASTAVAATTC